MEALDLLRRFFWTRLELLDFVLTTSGVPSTSITRDNISAPKVDSMFSRAFGLAARGDITVEWTRM